MSSAWVNILLSKSEVLSFSLLESGFLGLPTLVGKNFELPKNDNFTIKNKENDSDIYKTFKQISEWSLDYRKNLYHKLSNFYLNYKKNYDYLCTLRIDNIYKATLLKKNILKSSTDFIMATLTYSFNFFLPAFLTVFFYLMGNYSFYHDIDDKAPAVTLSKYNESYQLIYDFVNAYIKQSIENSIPSKK
jgi:hypothetical protein